eukprot:scaffold15725_cov80-Skeletonema_marinoi.AAC.2
MMRIAVLRQHWVVSYATASALAVIVVQWRVLLHSRKWWLACHGSVLARSKFVRVSSQLSRAK